MIYCLIKVEIMIYLETSEIMFHSSLQTADEMFCI